jgi:parallel beta-helix repeat protein
MLYVLRLTSHVSRSNRLSCLTISTLLTISTVLAMNASAAIITVDDDGPADYQSIQAAIDAADEGDEIQVAAGTYTEHVEIGKNVHLRGEGSDVTWLGIAGESPTVLVTDVTQASIEGFTLAYTGPEIDDDFRCALWMRTSTMILSSVKITGTGIGIRCTNDSTIQITESQISGNRRSGIVLGSSNGQISNNIIQDNGDRGIDISDSQVAELKENEITANGSEGIALNTTTVENLQNNTIALDGMSVFGGLITGFRENQITTNAAYGIHLEAATIESFQNNTIEGNVKDGIIALNGSQMTLFGGNQLTANEDDGFHLETATIGTFENNIFKDNQDRGIVAQAESRITLFRGWDSGHH